MTNWLVLCDKVTGQVEAFVNSSRVKPPISDLGSYDHNVYRTARVTNPGFAISRDHTVTIANGIVTSTQASVNPVQPEPVDEVLNVYHLQAEINDLKGRVKTLEDAQVTPTPT